MADWGSIPAWIALGGGGGTVFSNLARRDAQRAPANAVFAIPTDWSIASAPGSGHVRIKLVNGGAAPIKDANVSVWDFGRRRMTWRFRKVTGWMTGSRLECRVYATVEPGAVIDDPSEYDAPPFPKKRPESIVPPILLTFRDGNGRQWVRWPNGRLNRIWRMRFGRPL